MKLIPMGASHAEAAGALESSGPTPSWTPSAIRASLELPTSLGWVALDQARLIGHLLSTVVADEAEVLILSVDPSVRRQGIGLALLRHAEQRWQASHVDRAFLEVRVDNTPARRLYERAGWRQTTLRQGYYADGADALVLSRQLRSGGTGESCGSAASG